MQAVLWRNLHFCAEYKGMEQTQTLPQKGTRGKPDIRELTLKHGIHYPSDQELLMLILNMGSPATPVETIAEEALKVIDTSSEETLLCDLQAVRGIGAAKALSVAAALELGRRRNCFRGVRITSPAEIVPFVKQYALKPAEHFITATINGARELLEIRVISVGTVNRALVHPREVFAEAVAEHAAGIICCHNHPCGPCLPSDADRESTRTLQKAAYILGMTFLDHIIITKEDYFSFLEHQLL